MNKTLWWETNNGKVWRKKYQHEYYAKWYAKNGRKRPDNYQEIIHEWRQEHPDRVSASLKLRNAVSKGEIVKPKLCQDCKLEKRLCGHHEDYLKPLKVVWLCNSCHKLRHLLTST